ncbi:MAG: hypothetical protein V8Q86_09580 [Blautia sp.]
MHLAKQMMDFDNIADCENELTDFSAKINAAFWIEDSNGCIIYPNEASTETSTVSSDQTVTFDEDASFIDMQPSGTTDDELLPDYSKKRYHLYVGSSNGFVCCTAGNKSITVHTSVCHPNGFCPRSPMCMDLYAVHYSTYCATE